MFEITINPDSQTPKYIQVVESVINMVEEGKLKLGERLPSINSAYKKLGISRDTLINAYDELQSRGIISSKHGKGYYISSVAISRSIRVFVLFDVMNGYKSILYRSLKKNLGAGFTLDIYFHHYNLQIFKNLIENSVGNYAFYVIMPHFNEDVSDIISKLPTDKVLLIDKDVPELSNNIAGVYQDFHNDILQSLNSGAERIKKYKQFFMVVNKEFQFIPEGLLTGFNEFADTQNIRHGFIDDIKQHTIKTGDAFLVFTDNDLVDLIKISGEKGLDIGKDIGIISYDETPLKEVLAGGITVISTDFKKMGETAAHLITTKRKARIENPCQLIIRNTL